MLTLLAIRCLNCNNVDEFPRMDYDQIPYCSQCSSTTNLVPVTPPTKPSDALSQSPPTDDLSALFSRTLSLLDQAPHSTSSTPPPLSPPATTPTTVNFSVSQHYIQPTAFNPPPTSAPTEQDRDYVNYLLTSNLGSSTSTADLQIARAHGLISDDTYLQAVTAHNHIVSSQQQQLQEDSQMVGLEEECSAHDMLSLASSQKNSCGSGAADPAFRSISFFQDYYTGSGGELDDEETGGACTVYGGAEGRRLRPFDLVGSTFREAKKTRGCAAWWEV